MLHETKYITPLLHIGLPVDHTVTAVVTQETNKFSHKEISVIELDSICVFCVTHNR